MRNPWIWSVSLGRWWNVHVRVHMMFFFFATFVLYLTSQFPGASDWLGAVILLTFLGSVLLHEISHVIVARRLGGIADEVVIAPLGGLSSVRVPYEPHSELVALMAGILTNAAVCFACAVSIGLSAPSFPLIELLQPSVSFLQPDDPVVYDLTTISILKIVFWVNWCLILVNLLPVYPFDGGRSLHAALTFLWPEVDSRQSHLFICRLGKVIAAVGGVAAILAFQRYATGPQPPLWFVLTLLSIYVYFNSRREEIQQTEVEMDDDTVFGYDFSQGYTSLERSSKVETETRPQPQPGLIRAWLERRREKQEQMELEQEADDERRVDEVLKRLHDQGMPSLSTDDKALLNRVSQRYRSRET